jgi:peptidoglycan/xylan/chitin deacetylase (PgdA/CDA1 family)
VVRGLVPELLHRGVRDESLEEDAVGVAMADRFPVLMYHRIESPSCPVASPEEVPWAVALSAFERHMQRLRELGCTGVSMDRIHGLLQSGRPVPDGWVGLTFDDGNASDFRHALGVLAGHGFSATFFVCGERVGSELSRENLREMHAAGMHIGSHALHHRFMTTLAAAEEQRELVESRRVLEQAVGATVNHFAPPGGRWSRRTRDALVRAGYVAVSTSRYGFNASGAARFDYCRLPVVATTTPGTFDAMVGARRGRLWKGYARAVVVGGMRSLLGEARYARARAMGKDAGR